MSGLKYVGGGSFLPGIPARDLLHEEVVEYGGYIKLKSSGLYQDPEEKKTKMERPSRPNKMESGPKEDK